MCGYLFSVPAWRHLLLLLSRDPAQWNQSRTHAQSVWEQLKLEIFTKPPSYSDHIFCSDTFNNNLFTDDLINGDLIINDQFSCDRFNNGLQLILKCKKLRTTIFWKTCHVFWQKNDMWQWHLSMSMLMLSLLHKVARSNH